MVTETRKTTFTCNEPASESVQLAGSFNEWDPEATPMKRQKDGTWSVALELPIGRHEYKFIVDGMWCCQSTPQAGSESGEVMVRNPFGSVNHVTDVA